MHDEFRRPATGFAYASKLYGLDPQCTVRRENNNRLYKIAENRSHLINKLLKKNLKKLFKTMIELNTRVSSIKLKPKVFEETPQKPYGIY